jgi:hypothetical protein
MIGSMPSQRQQLLHLWLLGSSVDEGVVAWSFFDSTNGDGPQPPLAEPPYPTGLDAMRDGWMLIQAPSPVAVDADPHQPGGYIDNEFLFERRIPTP